MEWKCAGYFQPAKPSGKANGKKRSEEGRSPLSAAYKAVLEAQIVEGTEVCDTPAVHICKCSGPAVLVASGGRGTALV